MSDETADDERAAITRTRGSWGAMRTRCLNPNHMYYSLYGGRGIKICDRWLEGGFQVFLADMGLRPVGHTIDRIDPDGNYEPGNCRWATSLEQRHNWSKPRSPRHPKPPRVPRPARFAVPGSPPIPICAAPDCPSPALSEGLDVCSKHTVFRLGITYRQLDYWVRKGYLRPEGEASPGTGIARQWPAAELDIARRMGRLVAAGFPPERAAAFARNDWPRGEIAPGIMVEVTADSNPPVTEGALLHVV